MAWSVSRATLSGVRTEDSRPGGFLDVTEPFSRHCLTHQWIAFGDGASSWFRSRRNPHWVYVIDLVQINSSTAHTHVLLLPSAPRWLNLKVSAYVQIPALRDTLAEKHITKILKCFTISATSCTSLIPVSTSYLVITCDKMFTATGSQTNSTMQVTFSCCWASQEIPYFSGT